MSFLIKIKIFEYQISNHYDESNNILAQVYERPLEQVWGLNGSYED